MACNPRLRVAFERYSDGSYLVELLPATMTIAMQCTASCLLGRLPTVIGTAGPHIDPEGAKRDAQEQVRALLATPPASVCSTCGKAAGDNIYCSNPFHLATPPAEGTVKDSLTVATPARDAAAEALDRWEE